MGVSYSMSFFFSFFSFQETQFPFHFAPGLSTTCRWDSYLSDRCSSGLLLYYFFFLCLFRYIREGAHPIVSHQHCKKKYPFSFDFFLTQVFFICAQTVVGRPDGGGQKRIKKKIYIFTL